MSKIINTLYKFKYIIIVTILIIYNLVNLKTGSGLKDDYSLLYIPTGYELKNSQNDTSSFGKIITHDYMNNENRMITLQVSIYDKPNWTTAVETNGDSQEFNYNNNTYTKASNYDLNQIMWDKGNEIYVLYGEVPMDLLEKIIRNTF